MIKSITKKTNNKKGFTLIELIVVIAILGILAAIAIPRLTGFQQTARERTDVANQKILVSVGTLYVAEKGNPTDEVTATFAAPGVLESYVEDWPTNPFDDTDDTGYTVTIDTNGKVTVPLLKP